MPRVRRIIHGGLRAAHAHLNRKLSERDLGHNIRSLRQTHGQYLDHRPSTFARWRLRANSFRDCRVIARHIRPGLCNKARNLVRDQVPYQRSLRFFEEAF